MNKNNTGDPYDKPTPFVMAEDAIMVSVIDQISDKMADLKIRIRDLEKIEQEHEKLKEKYEGLIKSTEWTSNFITFLGLVVEKDPLSLCYKIREQALKTDKSGDLVKKYFEESIEQRRIL